VCLCVGGMAVWAGGQSDRVLLNMEMMYRRCMLTAEASQSWSKN